MPITLAAGIVASVAAGMSLANDWEATDMTADSQGKSSAQCHRAHR